MRTLFLLTTAMILPATGPSGASPIDHRPARLVEREPNPHGSPRPFRDAKNVPIRSSLYVELTAAAGNKIDPSSVTLTLRADGSETIKLLEPGPRFVAGSSGWLREKGELSGDRSLALYLEPNRPMKPQTRYTAAVQVNGEEVGSWSFTTEAPHRTPHLDFRLDLSARPVDWHGAFFSGICNVVFCSKAEQDVPTYDLMAAARKDHPRAWSYQRDFWTTGTEFRPPSWFLPNRLPNIVRERETRRILTIEPRGGKARLRLTDLDDRALYGIPPDRPIADDYHPGDEVLIADGLHDATAKVLAVETGAVVVSSFPTPNDGWMTGYEQKFPDHDDPDAPGRFPPGGCYLRKLRPAGTPCYYWGRLDQQYDLIHRRYGRRLMVNFADAAGETARDGRSWTTAKDLAEWHEVALAITGHLIDRYGDDALAFTWSVFNEPDLSSVFWRASWDDLQDFYDVTTDAILRAFEDRGLDSRKVVVGGLELGAIFGTNLRLREFLAHCSPTATATAKGARPLNAAFADPRLDGKRSRRVEQLCQAHGGKGSPCDFVSIHSYDRSRLMAAKLIRAREIALEIDPAYYAALWVNSHESCPDWMPPPDQAAGDAYRGDGYFVGWCADVVRRLLARASLDPRYGYGETILTVWPPPTNFAGLNAVTRILQVDTNGDGRPDRSQTVPMPIFHMMTLLSDLGDRYWVLPDRVEGGHVISGIASRDQRGTVRVLVYAHDDRDTQSRSEATFTLSIDLQGRPGPAIVEEYRFDRRHNSPFRLAGRLRDRSVLRPADAQEFARLAELHPTAISTPTRQADGSLQISTELAGNGCSFLVITP